MRPGGDSSGGNQRYVDHLANVRNQHQGGGFFSSVVTSGLEAFRHNGINARRLSFEGKLGVGNHMHYCNSLRLEFSSPGGWIPGRGEHDFHTTFDNDLHVFLDVRVEQRHIHSKRLSGSGFALSNLFTEHFRIHRSGAEQTKSAGIAHCRS